MHLHTRRFNGAAFFIFISLGCHKPEEKTIHQQSVDACQELLNGSTQQASEEQEDENVRPLSCATIAMDPNKNADYDIENAVRISEDVCLLQVVVPKLFVVSAGTYEIPLKDAGHLQLVVGLEIRSRAPINTKENHPKSPSIGEAAIALGKKYTTAQLESIGGKQKFKEELQEKIRTSIIPNIQRIFFTGVQIKPPPDTP